MAVRQIMGKSREEILDAWVPKTELGRKVKAQEVTDIDLILDRGERILEPEIVDSLLPNLQVELLEVGQSKGKFGGGKSSIWKQTQKITREGSRMKFSTCAIVGNKDGYFGIGYGSAKETVPAREKAIREAKLNTIKIPRGCGSWACGCGEPHSIPYTMSGKVGSSKIEFAPAPKGTGLSCQKQCKKMLELVGVKDVYSKTFGQTKTRLNLVRACMEALKNLSKMKVSEKFEKFSGMVDGSANKK